MRLIYERGRFDAGNTIMVAQALQAYAAGVVFYAGVKAGAPLFIASGDTRTPMLCSLFGIAVNLATALLLIDRHGHVALAVSVAAGAAANYGALRLMAMGRFGAGSRPGWGFLLRVVLASGAMGGLGWLLSRWLVVGDGAVSSPWLSGALTLALICVLALFYFLVSAALGIAEVRWMSRSNRAK